MELALIIYLISIADPISLLFCFLSALIAISVFAGIGFNIEAQEDHKFKFPRQKRWYALSILFMVLSIATPSKETAYAMLAAYGVQSVAENPDVKKIAENSLKLIDQTINKYLEETEAKPNENN